MLLPPVLGLSRRIAKHRARQPLPDRHKRVEYRRPRGKSTYQGRHKKRESSWQETMPSTESSTHQYTGEPVLCLDSAPFDELPVRPSHR
jgi:hypothetical protein